MPGPLGSWADPAFSLDYDLEVEAQIALHDRPDALTVGPAKLRMTHVSWDSQNFAGDLVKIADSAYRALTSSNEG